MADQTQRLEIATVKAEIASDILSRFSNDSLAADPIPTDSGDIQNLKQVSASIEADGQAAITQAVANGIVDLTGAVGDASASADRSDSSASLAAAFSKPFPSTADGVANTSGSGATNRFFSIPASGSSTLATAYRNDAGVAVKIGQAPSVLAVDNVAASVGAVRSDLNEAGQVVYAGSGPVWPVLADSENKVLLGYDQSTGKVFGEGLLNDDSVIVAIDSSLGDLAQADYIGSGPIFPIVTDSLNRVLLGYDASTGKLVGEGLEDSPDPAAWPIPKAINHLLLYGESLAVGAAGTPILSTTQPYSNITFSGGPRAAVGDYSSFKPLVEDELPAPDGVAGRGETSCSGAANYASKLSVKHNGALPQDHIILSSTAGHGGYTIQQLEKGAEWYAKLLEHVYAAKALNSDYAVQSVVWFQGSNGALTMDYSTYYTKLVKLRNDIDADIRSITGQASYVHLHTAQISYQVRLNSATALAQLHAVQRNERLGFIAPCYHLPFATDKVHLTNRGYKWFGAYAGRAYQQTVHEHRKPDFLEPVSAVATGRTVRIQFNVPTAPLVFDTTTLAVTTDHGFAIKDSSGTLAIESFSLGETHVDVTLVVPPLAGATVRYGLDYMAAALRILDGGSGNLRDSTSDAEMIGGTICPLYHVAPHFELNIIESKEI